MRHDRHRRSRRIGTSTRAGPSTSAARAARRSSPPSRRSTRAAGGRGSRRAGRRRRRRHDLHLPDASRDPAGPSGQLPEVRHGAGAGAAEPRGGREPRARDFRRRFWWTLPLTVVVTVLAMFGHRLGWFDMRHAELDRAGAVAAGRAVGRLAVLRARRAVDRQPQPEHVDADRPGHRRRLRLQRGRDRRARRVPGLVRRRWAASRSTSRPRSSSSR